MINIKAVGDICPGDKNIMGLGVLHHSKKYGPDFPLREANEFLQNADLILGNFEGLLSAKVTEENGSTLTFCGLPDFAHALLRSGFNVLNVANNHSLEHGLEIFIESVDLLQSAGIHVCGLRSRTGKFYSEPVIFETKGRRIGILGYNWVGVDNFKEADEWIAQSHTSIVNYTWDRKDFKRIGLDQANKSVIDDIKNLKSSVDLVLLMTHWGYEYVTVPPYHLTVEARSFIDAGADIIIGGHPHVLQGMEAYRNGLIFYSLGNFIFDFREKLPRYTAVLDITADKEKRFTYKFNSLFINNRFQPCKADLKESQEIQSIIQLSNESLSVPDNANLLDDDRLYRTHEAFYNKLKRMKIAHYFLASLRHPSLAIVIVNKGFGFFKILWARLNGQRVRW
jgi:poly-gamma-glutamate synthesis protein (capsule biosynthesis protein)